MAEKISLFKEVKTTKREIADARRRHRFHRPHADRQGLSRRLQHDAWRRRSAATSIQHAVERAGVDPAEVEDVILGCAHAREARPARNIARQAAIRAGLPVTVGGHDGQPLLQLGPAGDRARGAAHHRGRGLGASSPAALESISLVQDGKSSAGRRTSGCVEHKPDDLHADDRDRRHRRASATRSAARRRTTTRWKASAAPRPAQQAGRFDDEIVPLPTTKKVVDKDTKAESFEQVTLDERRGQPPRHHARRARRAEAGARGRASSPPAMRASFPTAPRPAW